MFVLKILEDFHIVRRIAQTIGTEKSIMKTLKFYGHFAAALGSLWIFFFLIALLTQSHVNLGTLGFFGFPIVSAIYAHFRMKADPRLERLITGIGTRIDFLLSKKSQNTE